MLPLITVVDIAHTTPQGVSSGETLQGVSHYDGAKDWAGYRMHHSMNNNWEGVDCGLGRIPPCMVQLVGVDCGLGRILLVAATGTFVW